MARQQSIIMHQNNNAGGDAGGMESQSRFIIGLELESACSGLESATRRIGWANNNKRQPKASTGPSLFRGARLHAVLIPRLSVLQLHSWAGEGKIEWRRA